jgi:hypothetical protein
VPVQLHLAALDGFAREAARFEEPRCPEPFVDPDRIAHAGIVTVVGAALAAMGGLEIK